MLEAGLEGEVLGFSFDGSGLGDRWTHVGSGGDAGRLCDFERLFHFEYLPLPGGDKASREPWRMGHLLPLPLFWRRFL